MTTEERLEVLENELARAKRGNRRLLLAGAGIMLGILALFLANRSITSIAQGQERAVEKTVIRANEFILLDEQGRERGKLAAYKDGPRLDLFDETGKLRAALIAHKGGPGLWLYDENDKLRVGLAAYKGGPTLGLYDAAGKVRAELNTDKNAPTLEGNAPLGDHPPQRGLDTEGYVFTELATVRISPRFELEQDLNMGQWSYKAYGVLDKNTGQVSQALQLQVELQPVGLSLPPLFVEVQARSSGNRLVGSGTLFAKRFGIIEKLPYEGILLVDSFGEIDVITIRGGGP